MSLQSCKEKKEKVVFEDQNKQSGKEGFQYQIKGKINNLQEKKVYLQKMGEDRWITVDSSEVNEGGTFSFAGKAEEKDFYLVSLKENPSFLVIVDSPEIEIQADATDVLKTLEIKGSQASREYIDFTKKLYQYGVEENKIKSQIPALAKEKNKITELEEIERSLKLAKQKRKAFVQNYIDSIIPSIAVFNMINYLDMEEDYEYFIALGKKLKEEMPESKYTSMLSAQIEQFQAMKEEASAREEGSTVGVGKTAPEIALPDPKGNIVKLSSLRGKYVLIDFWASWCGPCRAENPNVVRVYNKFKNKNFEILGVSLDQDKLAWVQAINKDNLAWTHVSDLKAWESVVVPLYGLEGIPATFLIDPKGVIIAKNLRGGMLEDKLEEVLK